MTRTTTALPARAACSLLLWTTGIASHAVPLANPQEPTMMQSVQLAQATPSGAAAAAASTAIPGYTLGAAEVARSPLSDAELELLKKTLLFSDDDVKALRLAGQVLDDQIEAVLDVWYGYVGANAHLLTYFSGKTGEPNPEYLAAVRKRFGQWIRDTTAARYDRAWLDYQYEVGLRHTRLKKNKTDGVQSAAAVIHMRYLIAFIYPITATIKPFLAKKGHNPEEVDKMYQAWFKAVTLTAVLWSQPFVPAVDF